MRHKLLFDKKCGWILFILAFGLLISQPAFTGDERTYQIVANRTHSQIEIDGQFNESDWQSAQKVSNFVQVEPDPGQESTQRTEVRILYDTNNIYFGFTCYDTDISKLVANEMRRDARNLHENDNVFLILDTYDDRRNGVAFRFNALSAIQDMAVTNSGDSLNRNWDVVVDCQSQVETDRWLCEISIPFSQLRFRKSNEMIWGINLARKLSRNDEESTWVPVPSSYGGRAKYRTENLGRLVGITGISPNRNLEILPYFLPGLSHINDQLKPKQKVGLDIKYGLTTNLTTDLTINTDFAQVEADDEQVNLTRFSLFYPEKRPFFLEGAGLFDVGIPRTSYRRPPPLLLFYSRRIGIEDGDSIPILAGGKVTGKIGSYSVGMLNAHTQEFDNTEQQELDTDVEPLYVPSTNFSVVRVNRDISSGSNIGMIAINKQNDESANRTGGLDFAYRPSEKVQVRGLWAMTTSSSKLEQSSQSWYMGSKWRGDLFQIDGSFSSIGQDFNPEVGFVRQTGVRRLTGELDFTPWVRRSGIRRIWAGPEFDLILNQENQLVTRDLSFGGRLEFSSGGWSGFQIQNTTEVLEEPFEIRSDVIIPVDEYNFTSFRAMVDTPESRMISGGIGGSIGQFYNGSRYGIRMGANLKTDGHLILESDYEFNRIQLPVGNFNVSLISSRLVYSVTTTLFTKIFFQWNSDTHTYNYNCLLNWIYRPGSDLFLVLNHIVPPKGESTSSAVLAKFTYWWSR